MIWDLLYFRQDYKKLYLSVDPICFQDGTDRNSALIDKKQYENCNFEKYIYLLSFETISLIDFIEPLIKLARAVGG